MLANPTLILRVARAFPRFCVVMLGQLLALLLASPAGAQLSRDTRVDSILYVGVHVMPDGAAPLPHRVAEAIDRVVTTVIGRSGTAVLRGARGDGAACSAADYRCILSTSHQQFDLLLDVKVQKNDENSYYVVAIFVDHKNPDEASSDNLSYFAGSDGEHSTKTVEEGLASAVAEKISTLLDRYQHGTIAPQTATAPSLPKGPVKLTVAVDGPGLVSSEPIGISCGASCEAEFPRGIEPTRVTLVARPRGAATLLGWSQADCATGGPCALLLNADLHIGARFGRSTTRKVLTGILGGLAGASLVISAAMFGLDGHSAGACEYGGVSYSDGCTHNTKGTGLLFLGLTVAFEAGAAAAWWAPAPGH